MMFIGPSHHNTLRIGYLILLLVIADLGVSAQTTRDDAAPSTGTISGRVISDSGQPLANVAVSIRGSQPMFQARTAMTDAEGNFHADGLEPLLYGVTAFAPGYVPVPRPPDSPPDYYRLGETVTVTLVKGGVITGSVQSASGEPMVQVSVKAVMVRDANGQRPRVTGFQMQRATDDRGLYRIYGLVPGTYVVSAGGRGLFSPFSDSFENDAPTYAPSSPRDTAAEVVVRAGEETSGVDIRYRGEQGRMISGIVSGGLEQNPNVSGNVTLVQLLNDLPVASAFTFQQPGGAGFAFYGLADGDYELSGQMSVVPGETAVSDVRKITVKGADVTGVELLVKPLGTIQGRVHLEKSTAPECNNKREPLFSETLVFVQRQGRDPKEQSRPFLYSSAQGSPNKTGEFLLRNLMPGSYSVRTRFFARYWYLHSISREVPSAGSPTSKRQVDLTREGITLKSGDRQRDVVITLAAGAGSLRGNLKRGDEAIAPGLHVHLVPAEKENADNFLRFFADEVQSDGNFSLSNVPPGKYFVVARVAGANETRLESNVRLPAETELRARIRKAAETAKTEVEFKPCQNIVDYQLK